MRFPKRVPPKVQRELKEIDEILKKQGFNRAERRTYIKTIRKQAKLRWVPNIFTVEDSNERETTTR